MENLQFSCSVINLNSISFLGSKKSIVIVGGGASALILACSLDNKKYNISLYEKNNALGRKFLVAGKGGFNLTHSENIEDFSKRYHPQDFAKCFLNHFSNSDFRNWLMQIGIETYVGSSKRVFPLKGIKPIEVLKKIETQLKKNQVSVFLNHKWQGWNMNELLFSNNGSIKKIQADIVIFALGGNSWKITGSDGNWVTYFNEKNIKTNPFFPSNCAYKIDWDKSLIKNISGQAIKNVQFSCGDITKKGEAILTDFGIEGSGIYALSSIIRKQLIVDGKANVFIDFKPSLSKEIIKAYLQNRGNYSVKDILEKKIKLSKIQIRLIQNKSSKEEYHDADFLCKFIKAFPLILNGFPPIDEAISTVGGVCIEELNGNLELRKLPNHFVIGEMIDWDAPTGGYLLQLCFSMGKFLADELNSKLNL